MKILHQATELQTGRQPVGVAIGVFDGVHLGHQQVIRDTVETAHLQSGLSVVVTFDRHPNAVVAPERVPPMLYSQTQKLSALAALRLDATLLIQFDEKFSRLTGEEFIRGLARDFRCLRSIAVGADFVFGFRRSGNIQLLRALGQELGYKVDNLESVTHQGPSVSSTRIRELVGAGQFALAGQLLGRPYALAGVVVAGDQLGRTIGIPTANLDVAGRQLPPAGVYAVRARVGERAHRAVVNIGARPTIVTKAPAVIPRVEAHLLDFSGDLYGQELELMFVGRIRDERKFASLEALRLQIADDITAAREMLGP